MLTYAEGMLLTLNIQHIFVEIISDQIAILNIKVNFYYYNNDAPQNIRLIILIKKIYSSKLKNIEIWTCFYNNKVMKIVLHSNDENLYKINKCI